MSTTQTGGQAIETMLLEERRYEPPKDFAAQANATADIYERDWQEFWETEGRERVTWFEPFIKLLEWDQPYAKWYIGGKLNVCFNCVDRHVAAGNGDKVAYYWEAEPADERRTITFADLQREVVTFANALKELGVRKGTPVGIYMGMVPETAIAMLACTRLGAPHTVVFGGFSADSLSGRLNDMECELLDAEDLLYLLYTSGTTAKPKGIVHTTAGYLVGVATTHHYIFDVKPDSVYWCAADVGWVTGHSYIVYGPLCNGTTGVMYEGVPNFPNPERWWEIVERYKVDILYTAPTAIRSHMKWGPEWAEKHDLSSLRLLGSVGEPINPEAWVWYREHIGGDRTPVVDTWWQTETGMILITPLPGITTLKPGSATKPFPGVEAAVYDEQGNEVGPGGGGYLVLRKPWPAMLRGIYKDDERYVETYWSKFSDVYFAGDGARIDEDGDFWLLGRVDDVMNVSGHRISTIEVESALVDHREVAEAAVCGRSDPQTGQAIVAYVSLKGGEDGSVDMLEVLREHVAKKIGKIARPANIVFTPELPKTRSGKIMRRLLRDVSENRALGDTTTLADPTVVEEIKTRATAESSEEE